MHCKKTLLPSIACLEKVQSKLRQKEVMRKNKIPTLDFIKSDSKAGYRPNQKGNRKTAHKLDQNGDRKASMSSDQKGIRLAKLQSLISRFGSKCVFKKAHLGYDGHGTFFLDLTAGIAATRGRALILKNTGHINGYFEAHANFKKEMAVIVARSTNGDIVTYPVIETFQKGGRCDWAVVPARIPLTIQKRAQGLAKKVVKTFGGSGVFGVEMFWLEDGHVVINEIAPRVHNSGHITQNLFDISQFELHLRAISGMKLFTPKLLAKAGAMVNIIGQRQGQVKIHQGSTVKMKSNKVSDLRTWIHWYGKSGNRVNRKLGHINALSDVSVELALKNAKKVRQTIKV
jgi:5-(carboxyamino)imidazole ribonucleotide synthase